MLSRFRLLLLFSSLLMFMAAGLALLAILPADNIPTAFQGIRSEALKMAKKNGAMRKYGPRLQVWLKDRIHSLTAPSPAEPPPVPDLSARMGELRAAAADAAAGPDYWRRPFDAYWNWARADSAHVLDKAPEEWLPPKLDKPFARDTAPAFNPDDMPEPAPADIEKWRAETPLVRRLPYPYARAVSIPSDACATWPADYFYTGTLLSRRYGLDLGSSFFIHTSALFNNYVPALFNGASGRPASTPAPLEDKTLDWWPLFLSLYSRGWVDHYHGWSNGALWDATVAQPQELTLAVGGG